MKHIFLIISLVFAIGSSKGQIQIINTGTTNALNTISICGNNIMVGGNAGYLSKSYDECTSLSLINAPSVSAGTYTEFKRIDTNHIFLFEMSGNYSLIFKSNNGGNSWTNILYTDSIIGEELVMFDSLEGILMCFNFIALHTYDGGQTWATEAQPLFAANVLSSFGDSTICAGAQDGFAISNNRGHNWSYVSTSYLNSGIQYSFYFLSKDTIYSVSNSPTGLAYLSYSDSSGLSWTHHLFPLTSTFMAYGVAFLNKNEGYVVGTSSNATYNGIIYKTMDRGLSWEKYDTGLPAVLTRINFLNDSIALIAGTNGMLFKWNKNSYATEVLEINNVEMQATAFPNPTSGKIDIETRLLSDASIKVINFTGEIVLQKEHLFGNHFEFDISTAANGLHFAEITEKGRTELVKVVKW